MSIPKEILQENPALNEWSILTAYRGSIAHGMFVPNSNANSIDDKDVMAVTVPPKDYYFGLRDFGSRGTKEIFINEWDIVIYEFKKFMGLLKKGNPNVLSMLWLEPSYYIKITDEGRMLIHNKHLFVGKHVYHSFNGYAYSQLQKMKPKEFKGYMGEKRKALVEKFGYDCKNAAHLIRLLRMAIEFLVEGRLHVLRKDAQQLLEIKNGLWTLKQVKSEADRLFKLCEEAYVRSTLPNEPDVEGINRLCVRILDSHFEKKKIMDDLNAIGPSAR